MRISQGLCIVVSTVALAAGAAAQQVPQIDPEFLRRAQVQDRSDLQLSQPLQAQRVDPSQPDYNTGSGYAFNQNNELWYGWVNFDQDRLQGLVEGPVESTSWREQAGGVRFATGQSGSIALFRCGSGSNSCAVPQAESPDALIARTNTGALRIDFARPVAAVSAVVAPDRSFDVEADLFVMEGWRDGDIASVTRGQVEIYDSNARGWTRLTLSGLADTSRTATSAATAGAGTEFDYVIIRALTANGSATRSPFIVDAVRFADRYGSTPFDSLGPRAAGFQDMLDETRQFGARLSAQAEVIQDGGRREDLQYPAAQWVRMPMDREMIRRAAQRQRRTMAMDLPESGGFRGRERMTVPILAPLGVFTAEDPELGIAEHVRFTGRRDYFHLRFDSQVGRAVVSGTRIVTPGRPGEPGPGELLVSAGYDGAYASFNLYGAAYSVRVACGTEETDEPCNDPEALRTLLDRLILWMPEEG